MMLRKWGNAPLPGSRGTRSSRLGSRVGNVRPPLSLHGAMIYGATTYIRRINNNIGYCSQKQNASLLQCNANTISRIREKYFEVVRFRAVWM
jgi:hypothetical protein